MTGRGFGGEVDTVALLGRLAAVFERRDPVPASATLAARRAGARVADAGLGWLALVADGPLVAGLRGGGAVVGFAGEAGAVDVELAADGPGLVRLTGLVSGGLAGDRFAGDGLAGELADEGSRVGDGLAGGRFAGDGLAGDRFAGSLAVRWPDGSRVVGLDRFGRFAVGGLPAGPLSLALSRAGRPAAVTPWFVA